MENASLIALSRQLVLRRQLDIAANNIANADTTGFKVEQLIVETEDAREARNLGVTGPGRFVLDQGVGRDFGQGAIRETGRPLDVAIEGDAAFFRIGDPAGGSRGWRLHHRWRGPADHPLGPERARRRRK